MNIVVLGSNGQLGKSFKSLSDTHNFTINYVSKKILMIDNFEKVKTFLANIDCDVLINAAAYTNVDQAEFDLDQALLINHLAVKNLSEICRELGILLIHFSTDYVFDGKLQKPYKETDNPCPLGNYGLSKLEGEKSIINSKCNYIIFRTSWLYSQYGNNFLKTMLSLFLNKKLENDLYVVNDQIGKPTYAEDLAGAVIYVLKKIDIKNNFKEIYHFSGNKKYSWYQFANAIFEISNKFELDLINKPMPISTKKYDKLKNQNNSFRPMFSVLDNNKFFKYYSYNQQDTLDSIKQCIKELYINL